MTKRYPPFKNYRPIQLPAYPSIVRTLLEEQRDVVEQIVEAALIEVWNGLLQGFVQRQTRTIGYQEYFNKVTEELIRRFEPYVKDLVGYHYFGRSANVDLVRKTLESRWCTFLIALELIEATLEPSNFFCLSELDRKTYYRYRSEY